MSEQPSVVVALSKVMEDVRAVAKADRNTQQNYSFRGVDAVMNAVGPALRTHGVVVMPICEEANYRDVTTSTGKPSRECTVLVRYRFYGPKGDFIEAVTPGESMDVGDKGAPKAMSVAYRIVLLQALCLPTHETDPDAQSYERATPGNGRVHGRGRPPAEPAPAELTPADEARAALRATCTANGYDMAVVANRYKAQSGIALRGEVDAAAIEAFRESLAGFPSHELKAPEPASTNGAAR